MEPPKGPIDIQRQLAPLSWMISSKNLTIGVICSKSIIPSYSHLSWHVKVCFNIWKCHLWMIIMSLNVPMKFRLKSGDYINLPIMFLSLGDFVPPSVATSIVSISSANGSRNTNVNRATKSGGTIEGGGVREITNMRCPLLAFNPIVEFFCELQRNYQRVRIEKLQSL